MRLLVVSHPTFVLHDTGPGHPERPQRLEAVGTGIAISGAADAVIHCEPVPAPREVVARIHGDPYVDALEGFAGQGGGHLDPDTVVSPASFDAALLAAGAGLQAVSSLARGEADAALCVVRPPGHHATPRTAMGFCLLNNIAVAARQLADAGNRVLVVDYDAHHGNGTQDAFIHDPSVVYVSMHQHPLYPGTGAIGEMGEGAGLGRTINVPLPAGATGDVMLAAMDRIVLPVADHWRPDWLLVSAGFDAHRHDPLTGLALSAGDYALITQRLAGVVPPGRTVLFLEGGYDLDALAHCTAAVVSSMADAAPDAGRTAAMAADLRADLLTTSGGPGMQVVDAVVDRHRGLAGDGGVLR